MAADGGPELDLVSHSVKVRWSRSAFPNMTTEKLASDFGKIGKVSKVAFHGSKGNAAIVTFFEPHHAATALGMASRSMKVTLMPAPSSAPATRWGLPTAQGVSQEVQTAPCSGSSPLIEEEEGDRLPAIDAPARSSQAVASDPVAKLFLRQGKLDPDDLLNARAQPGGFHCWHW